MSHPTGSPAAFLAPHLKTLAAYAPGQQPNSEEKWLKLNTNENSFPPSPTLAEALESFPFERLRYYPDPNYRTLLAAAAGALNIPADHLVFGNGSDELLAALFKVFALRERSILVPEVTYGAYAVYCRLHRVKVESWETEALLDGGGIILERLTHKKSSLVLLANPNSPTGSALSKKALEAAFQTHPEKFFIVDEAYSAFWEENLTGAAEEDSLFWGIKYPNVMVLRTFSKACSLAGLRLGFGVAHREVITAFKKTLDPYHLNALTQHLGVAAFKAEEQAYFKKNCLQIVALRKQFSLALRQLGFTVLPSAANFIFASPCSREQLKIAANQAAENLCEAKAAALVNFLKEKKVLVRHFPAAPLGAFVRISLGQAEEMKQVLEWMRLFQSRGQLE